MNRRAHLLKQQTSITVFCWPTKENKLLFSICRKQREVCYFIFCLHQTNGSCRFPYFIEMGANI